MKPTRMISILALACILSLTAGCMSLIEKPAQDLNLSVDDLGAGWSLASESGQDELASFLEDPASIQDANLRIFSAEEKMVVGMVALMPSWEAAQVEVTDGQVLAFTNAFAEVITGEPVEGTAGIIPVLNPPYLGPEVAIAGREFPDLDLTAYEVHFANHNALVVVMAMGPSDAVDRGLVEGYAETIKGRITE